MNILCIEPLDQPSGKFRLIDWMEKNFNDKAYEEFYCIVAFAKIKPFFKLHNSIQTWISNGGKSKAIFGIDHHGTSMQALQYALANFDDVNILHVDYSTFHPKLYIFKGDNKATVYYGSSNFTTGGLETNFEGGNILNFDLPSEQSRLDMYLNCYESIIGTGGSYVKPLTDQLLNDLSGNGLLLDESVRKPKSSNHLKGDGTTRATNGRLFGSYPLIPARPISKSIMTAAANSAQIVLNPEKTKRRNAKKKKSKQKAVIPSVVVASVVNGFAIQVIPHKNGEILLSKLAVKQNESFFGFPFTGKTTPKKSTNPTYPQREPDPVVNIRVYDEKGALVNAEQKYGLNTIYYTKKAEVRITVRKDILSALNSTIQRGDFPILVMKLSSEDGCDYDLDFYASGSNDYSKYLAICNQTLPSGGNPISRKMGWF